MTSTSHGNEAEAVPRDSWVLRTNLVRQCKKIRRAVSEHKWYESEKAGHDVGWDRAAIDWMMRYGLDADERDRA